MKTIFTTLLILAALSYTADAQVNFGAKAGLNLYNVKANYDMNADLKAGINLGVLAHIHLTERFALQPELVYSMQGTKTDINGDKARLNLNYVNVPVLLQYMFANGLRLQAGPQIGVLASAKAKYDERTADVKSSFNSLDFGFPIGAGYVSPSGWGVDLRYNIGVSNINERDDMKAYNRGFQISAFFMFTHN